MISASYYAYFESKRVDRFRNESIAANLQLQSLTTIRAAVRNQILITLDLIFVSNLSSSDKTERLVSASVTEKLQKYKNLIADDKPLTVGVDSLHPYELELAEITGIQAIYQKIDSNLIESVRLSNIGELQQAKNLLRVVKSQLFENEFLKKIQTILDNENADFAVKSLRLDNSIDRVRFALKWLFLSSIFLSVGLPLYFFSTLGKRIIELEHATEAVSEGNFDIKLSTKGADEISRLASAFTKMVMRLNQTKAELLKQQQILIASTKFAALGEMAGGVAHEINNPLSIIYGRARQSQLKFSHLPDVVAVFAGIEKIATRIAKIVKAMKTFSRDGESDPMEPCLLTNILDDAIELCREKIQHSGIEFRQAPTPPHLYVSGRAVQLAQVVYNLIGNAIDALGILPKQESPPWIAVEVITMDTFLEVRIVDSGPGIPTNIKEKLMQPFFTTKAVGKGTGLGLSISSGICTAHGGRLYLDETGKNTTFAISLPILKNLSEQLQEAS